MKMIIKFLLLTMLVMMTACQTTARDRADYVAPDIKAAEINMSLGLNYMQQGEYEIALEKLQKSLKQNPRLASAHNTIAILYQNLGEMDKAESHYKKAIQNQADYSQAQNNYGVFLCQQQRYKEAEKWFLEAVKNPLYQSKAQAYENAGLCVNRIPEPELAETYLRKALQLDANLEKSLLEMSVLYYEKQDYLRARAYIERYRSAAQWTAQALLQAIKIENKLGDQNAVSSYTVLLKARFPDSEQARQVEQGQY